MKTCSIPLCDASVHNRGWCQKHHWRWKHHGDPLYKPYPLKTCSVSGCGGKHKALGLCKTHYERKRNGVPLNYERPQLAPHRYRIFTRPNHPLAWANGRVSEHRMVLFDSIQYNVAPCHWCGAGVSFAWGNLFVDHLNHDRQDNLPTNLVAACNGCNAGRTRANSTVRSPMFEVAC